MRALVAIAIAGCSFDHGRLPEVVVDDAPPVSDDARPIDARPIDAPIDARVCPAAPPTCVAFQCPSSTSCYYICGTASSGKQNNAGARSSCVNAEVGCIATINDQAEQDCLAMKTAPAFPNALVWFGFRQSSSGSEPDGGWSWDCGTSNYLAPNWGDFEPNNDGGSEDCAALTGGGAWLDVDCSGTAKFVCELP